MAEITDPALLQHLESGEITDPAALARLNEDPNRSVLDRLWGGTKATGQGAYNGLMGTLGLPGDLMNALQRGLDVANPTHFHGKEDLKKIVRDATGFEDYQPQNQGEKYASAGSEGLVSALTPGAPLRATSTLGLLSGLLGEAGAQSFNDSERGNNLGKTVGQVAPWAAGYPTVVAPKLTANVITHTVPSFAMPAGLTKTLMGVQPGGGAGLAGPMLRALVKSLMVQNLGNSQQ
jgi:hypothetical protein